MRTATSAGTAQSGRAAKLAKATGAVTAIKVSAVAVDARIRVTSHRLADPFLRQLPE